MRRVYLDSNVFIAVANQEIGRNLRGLYIEATAFLDRLKSAGDTLVLSGLFFKEVARKTRLPVKDVLEYFSNTGMQVEIMPATGAAARHQLEKMGVPYPDSVHAALAIEIRCDALVTFNVRDFEAAKSKISVLAPDEFY